MSTSTTGAGAVLAPIGTATAEVRPRLRRLAEYEPAHGASGDDTPPDGKRRTETHSARPAQEDAREKEKKALRGERAGGGPTRAALHGLVRSVLEVLDGHRPVTQLRELFDERAYTTIVAAVRTRTRTRASRRLRRLYPCIPAEGVVELCATVDDGPRVRAATARMERRGGRWRCTQFCLL
ncbi:MAG: Rv3235 family protein [Sciscionella sp.]